MGSLNPKRLTSIMGEMSADIQKKVATSIGLALARGFKISKAGDDWSHQSHSFNLEVTRFVRSKSLSTGDIEHEIVDAITALVKVCRFSFSLVF